MRRLLEFGGLMASLCAFVAQFVALAQIKSGFEVMQVETVVAFQSFWVPMLGWSGPVFSVVGFLWAIWQGAFRLLRSFRTAFMSVLLGGLALAGPWMVDNPGDVYDFVASLFQ